MASAESEAVSLAVPGESRTELVYIVSAVLTASSMIIFGLRLFTRCVLLKTAGSDDWTMLVAQILAIVAGVFTILGMYLPTYLPTHAGLWMPAYAFDRGVTYELWFNASLTPPCRSLLWPWSSYRNIIAEQY